MASEFIDSDDETGNLDLIASSGRGGVKDVKEIELAKQRKIDAENEKQGWKQLGGGQTEQVEAQPEKKAEKVSSAFDGSVFGRGGKTSGPPKFSSGNRSKIQVGGTINN